MADNTIQQILDDSVLIAPVWDDSVWAALQSKRFDEAGSYLAGVLSKFTPEEWGYINWEGILTGAPSLRGSIEMTDWSRGALPQIGGAVIRSASPAGLSRALGSVTEENLTAFRQLINSGLAGATPEEKMQGFKRTNLGLFNFIIGSPLGISPTAPLNSLQAGNLKRLATLPENLKMLMFSVQTPEIIRKITEQNNIPAEKIPAVAQAVGLALLGFIHPEDLAEEISKSGIASQTSAAVSKDLGVKLFSGVKQDIDKTYAPLPHDAAVQAPKILSEITAPKMVVSAPVPVPAAKPSSQPNVMSQTIAGQAKVGSTPLSMNQSKPAAPPPAPAAPKKLPEVGWSSRSTADEPVVKLSQASPSMPQPMSAQRPAPTPVRQMPSELKGSLGEFERIAMRQAEQKNIMPPPPPGSSMPMPNVPKPPAAPAAGPAPIIIHEDTVFKPRAQSADFRLQLPSEGFGAGQGGTTTPPPTKTVVMELGKTNPPAAPGQMAPAQRVVHYSEYQPPTPATPPASQAGRQITEMTMPKPPAVTPPTPGAPAPQNKVVYKDYTSIPPAPPPLPPKK